MAVVSVDGRLFDAAELEGRALPSTDKSTANGHAGIEHTQPSFPVQSTASMGASFDRPRSDDRKRLGSDENNAHKMARESKRPKVDEQLQKRSARMFGFLKNTLTRAGEDTKKSEDLLKKRQEIQSTVQERLKREKEDHECKLRQERADRDAQFKINDRLQELKRSKDLRTFMEAQTRTLANFLHTTTSHPSICYLPAKHTEKTAELLKTQRDEAERKTESRILEEDMESARLEDELREIKERREIILKERQQRRRPSHLANTHTNIKANAKMDDLSVDVRGSPKRKSMDSPVTSNVESALAVSAHE